MNIGDRVRCIRSVDAYTHVGAVYTVMDKHLDSHIGKTLLRLDVNPGTFYSPDYFERVFIHYDAPVSSPSIYDSTYAAPVETSVVVDLASDIVKSSDSDFSGGGGDFGGGGDSGSW